MSNTPDTQAPLPVTAPACWKITRAAALRIREANAQERFSELKAAFPSRAVRRMSRLGLMLAHLMEQMDVEEDTTLLYASTFGEGRMLETYLDSFPQASPLGFQSSIHPSGVEQGLILRDQPVREFFPLAGHSNMPLALLRNLQLCANASRILLLGGEESGIWLKDYHLAADTSFAFALLLEPVTEAAAKGLGTLRFVDDAPAPSDAHATASPAGHTVPQQTAGHTTPQPLSEPDNAPYLYDFCAAIDTRRNLNLSHPDWGRWTLEWA